jgi:hypothetical protein
MFYQEKFIINSFLYQEGFLATLNCQLRLKDLKFS